MESVPSAGPQPEPAKQCTRARDSEITEEPRKGQDRSHPTPSPPAPSDRHLEGAVGHMLAAKAHTDDIFARLGGCVEDVKGTILILYHVNVHLGAIGCAHSAGNLAFAGSLGVHSDHCFLPNLDGGADAST